MTKPIQIISVVHSGTHSIRAALEECFPEVRHEHVFFNKNLQYDRNLPVVCPVMDPLKSSISALASGRRSFRFPSKDIMDLFELPATFIGWGLFETLFNIEVFVHNNGGNIVYINYKLHAAIDYKNHQKFRTAYLEGDIDFLRKTLPDVWKNLVLNEKYLRPKLEACGFTDLLWWSK